MNMKKTVEHTNMYISPRAQKQTGKNCTASETSTPQSVTSNLLFFTSIIPSSYSTTTKTTTATSAQ